MPFVFVLDPAGVGLLLKTPPDGSWLGVAWIAFTACVGIAALACGVQRLAAARLLGVERGLLIAAGLALVYPASWRDCVGLAGVVARRRDGRGVRARREARAVDAMRKVDALFERYGESHRNPHQQGDPLGLRAADHLEPARGAVGGVARRRVRRSSRRDAVLPAWLSFTIAIGMLAVAALMVYPLTLLGDARLPSPSRCSSSRGSASSSGTAIEGQKPSFFEDVQVPAGRPGVAAAATSTAALGIRVLAQTTP